MESRASLTMRSGLDAWLVLLLAGALALSLTPLLHEPWTAAWRLPYSCCWPGPAATTSHRTGC